MDNLNDYMYPTCSRCDSRALWISNWDGEDENGNWIGGFIVECQDCGNKEK